MSFARHEAERFYARTGRPGPGQLDGAYQYETAVMIEMLDRLEAILDDEGVPRETAERVIRCMIYGSPSPAAAQMRMNQQEEMADLLGKLPQRLIQIPGAPAGGGLSVLAAAAAGRKPAPPWTPFRSRT